ncbi:thiol reductant ABC exporter subunit CydD [Microbacterium sp.]|uniref:thiol reductant ABC exporter subunit CydD n=1 Tax=Microbacterium sp. TaxID=51671 RepID=UPI003A83776D
MSAPDAGTRRAPVDPRLRRHAAASRGFFVALAAIALAQTAITIGFAWLLTQAIVAAISGTTSGSTLMALAVVVAARGVLLWARERVAADAAARVATQLREGVVDAVGRLGPGWLDTRNDARLAVTIGRGLEALDAYFGRYLPQLVATAVATPILVVVMWSADLLSGLTVLLTLPLIPLFMVLIGLATRTVQRRQWQTLGRLAARFTDTVAGLSTLKVYGRQHRAVDGIRAITDRYRRETMRVLRVSFLSGFALEFLASISVAIVAVSIGFRLLDGSLTLAVGLFVLLLAPEAYLPLRQVGVQYHAAAEGVAATDDVFAVLDEAARRPQVPATEPRRPERAAPAETLAVREVSVRRGEHRLPPVSFVAEPGTVTLITGPSGAGKSSLLEALRGATGYDGTILWSGDDIARRMPSTWLAWAGQDAGLIAGTVAGNVCLGDDAPQRSLGSRALELAAAGEVDLDRELGVQGAGLSGGQAQRVAVARAFYRHLRGWGPVLALDEPSAALDADTERRLWRSIRSLADDGATVLLVSHRTSAEGIADRVVRLAAEVPA